MDGSTWVWTPSSPSVSLQPTQLLWLLYFPISSFPKGFWNQAKSLFMGFWAQHAAAALMGSYVHSTMLCDAGCTLNAFLGETFVPFILFMVKSASNRLQLCVAVLCPKFCTLGFVGASVGLGVCAALQKMRFLVQTKGLKLSLMIHSPV